MPRYSAYLIPDSSGTEHIWLIIGENTSTSPLIWHDAGGFGSGSKVIINSVQQGTVDLTQDVTNPFYRCSAYQSSSDSGSWAGIVTKEDSPNNPHVQFGGLSLHGSNPIGTSITPVSSLIQLPIMASDSIEPTLVEYRAGNYRLGFKLTDSFINDLQSSISSTSAPEITISAPSTSTQGTFSGPQMAILTTNRTAYINFNNEIFRLADNQHTAGYLMYTHVGYVGGSSGDYIVKCITVNYNNASWVLTQQTVANPSKYYTTTQVDTLLASDYLAKTGGVMTGTITLPNTGYGIKTSQPNGYATETNGDFRHQRTDTRDAFKIKNSSGTATIQLTYETGRIFTRGSIIHVPTNSMYQFTATGDCNVTNPQINAANLGKLPSGFYHNANSKTQEVILAGTGGTKLMISFIPGDGVYIGAFVNSAIVFNTKILDANGNKV